MAPTLRLAILILFVLTQGTSTTLFGRVASDSASRKIIRFDLQLYQAIEAESNDSVAKLSSRYPQYMKIYSEGVINRSPQLLLNFFSNKFLRTLYSNAINKVADVSELEQSIFAAFDSLKSIGATSIIPKVYMHVSGMNQSIVVGDGFISISIDKYMGADFPMYKRYLPDYQSRLMVPEKIVSDCIRAWLYTEYPFTARDKSLREYMLYEGRILVVLSKIFPEEQWPLLFGYTEREWAWANNNVNNLWDYFNRRNLWINQDPNTIVRYMNEAPSSTFLAPDAPDRLGLFLGWKVADRYWKAASPRTIHDAMKANAATILNTVGTME